MYDKSQQHRNEFGNAKNQTQDGWVGSANTTSVLCVPQGFSNYWFTKEQDWQLSWKKVTHLNPVLEFVDPDVAHPLLGRRKNWKRKSSGSNLGCSLKLTESIHFFYYYSQRALLNLHQMLLLGFPTTLCRGVIRKMTCLRAGFEPVRYWGGTYWTKWDTTTSQ